MPGKYVNLSKGWRYLRCVMDDKDTDIQAFKDSLECDECHVLGSYYRIGGKYEIGVCLPCLIKHSPYSSIIAVEGFIVKDE